MSEPLLPRVAAGESDAVAACLDRYGNLVWSLARRLLASRVEAEDAVQEVFIDLWENASRFDRDKASETTFVAMIARRRLIDRMRRTRREPATEQIDAAADLGDSAAAEQVEIRSAAARASRLMRTLKPEQQQIIRLAVVDGHTHESIADALEIPLGTVKTHLRRGLSRIRDAMQAQAPGAAPRKGAL